MPIAKFIVVQVLVVVVIVNAISHGERPLQLQYQRSCTLSAMPFALHLTIPDVPSSQ